MILLRLLLCTFCLAICACKKEDKNNAPIAYFNGMSKYVMLHAQQDSFILQLSYLDIDGDLGNDTLPSLFLYDSRNNELLKSYIIPDLNPSGTVFKQEGDINITLGSPCCHLEAEAIADCWINEPEKNDSLFVKIVLKDKAGLESKPIMTANRIRLKCQR